MANIERPIKAALAKRGLEFSLKDETLYLVMYRSIRNFTIPPPRADPGNLNFLKFD